MEPESQRTPKMGLMLKYLEMLGVGQKVPCDMKVKGEWEGTYKRARGNTEEGWATKTNFV